MILPILNDFKSKFERRFFEQSILNLGEDSVRYDFFIALMNGLNLGSHQIQVEYPIHQNAFEFNQNPNSKRNENPQLDLYYNQNNSAITVEFGLFKKNSNPNGSINVTEKVFKMLNDMLRLSLNKIYMPNDSYFICIADSKILGSKMTGNILPIFPAENYLFSYNELNKWIKSKKTAKDVFDKRFVVKANNLEHVIKAKLIYNQQIVNPANDILPMNNLETRILVYKIE
jgi:hypothetical protein